jgi:hypothetical protein
LDAILGRDSVWAKEKMGMLRIAPFDPAGEAWKVVATFGQKGRAVHTVEGVRKIDLDENTRTIILIPPAPLPSDRQPHLVAHVQADPYLQREKVLATILLVLCT